MIGGKGRAQEEEMEKNESERVGEEIYREVRDDRRESSK